MVVAVEKHQIFPAGQRRSLITRHLWPLVGLLQKRYARSVRGQDGRRQVRGPVIDSEQLIILKRLRQHGVNSLTHVPLPVIYRHQNTESMLHAGTPETHS